MPSTTATQNSNPPAAEGLSAPSGASMKMGRRYTVLWVIAAILVPPAGLVMAFLAGMDRKRAGKTKFITTLLIASAIGVLGYITMFTGLINVKIPGIDKTKYSYQNTGSNEFSTVQSAGMTFSKPQEFTSTAQKSGPNYSTQSYTHYILDKYPLSFIFTFSTKDNHTADKDYVKGVNDLMSGAVKNSYRTQYLDSIKKQVFDSYPGYTATMGEPQKFTNANIKNNAWSFDLDITSMNPQVKPMKGKLVYVLGQGKIYYFSLMVTQDNWASNMSTWQTVLSSLKLSA